MHHVAALYTTSMYARRRNAAKKFNIDRITYRKKVLWIPRNFIKHRNIIHTVLSKTLYPSILSKSKPKLVIPITPPSFFFSLFSLKSWFYPFLFIGYLWLGKIFSSHWKLFWMDYIYFCHCLCHSHKQSKI